MDRWIRSVVAVFVVLAILGLIAYARGTPAHGEPTPPPAASITVVV
jgi:hypothetical protein